MREEWRIRVLVPVFKNNADLQSFCKYAIALERRTEQDKTEYMGIKENDPSGAVRLQGTEIKKVEDFEYLGSTVQSNGECGKEVEKRVQAETVALRKIQVAEQKIADKKVLRFMDGVKEDMKVVGVREEDAEDRVLEWSSWHPNLSQKSVKGTNNETDGKMAF
ncbi:hypothetical protein CRENBAI_012470 [Crenichthys baileyi]|uniref:Uncharacterized protein n=1 Tax=Crenichthys baileyi TaxID=28760 RepID=A0AAV9SFN2_9TELE